jgi:ribonuclease J
VDIRDGRATQVGQLENGYIFVDGKTVGQVDEQDLEHRKILSQEGFLAVSVTVDPDSKKVITNPRVVAKGIAEDVSAFYQLPRKVRKAVERAMQEENIVEANKLNRVVRKTAGSFVARELRRSPMILPLVSVVQETAV